MMFEIELTAYAVFYALMIVVAAIVFDALLGAINAIKAGDFDFKKLPQFVAVNVFPYAGGLLLFAVLANFVPDPYSAVFYPVAAAVLIKYLAEIKDKLSVLFGIDLGK